MTSAMWGGLLAATTVVGCWLIVTRVIYLRRPRLDLRVLPYLRDLPALASAPSPLTLPSGAGRLAPVLRTVADTLDRILGGRASVERRLDRAGLTQGVAQFRLEQTAWGLTGFVVAAVIGLVRTDRPGQAVLWLVVCALAFVGGVVLRDHHLSSQVKARERRVLQEFPAIAELLALAVAAGEGPVAALDRVVRRSGGEMSRDLARVLAAIRTGEPVADAFDRLAATTGQPLVSRFAQGVAVAVERGTPLADVLHAQAGDVREAGRRQLIETAASKEVAMMAPVVFLVMPITILFAFWPGVLGLSLTVP